MCVSAVSIPEPVPLPALRAGAVDFTEMSMNDQKCLANVLYRFKERVQQRRILALPIFQDFDRWVYAIGLGNKSILSLLWRLSELIIAPCAVAQLGYLLLVLMLISG